MAPLAVSTQPSNPQLPTLERLAELLGKRLGARFERLLRASRGRRAAALRAELLDGARISKPVFVVLVSELMTLRRGQEPTRQALRIAVVEKLHYHLVALVLVGVTLVSQNVDNFGQPSLLQRALFATHSVWHYIASFVWPWDLSPFYPEELISEEPGIRAYALIGATFLALAATAVVGGKRAIAFLAYFLVTLAPVLGLVKVGEQAYADRYTYLPMVGFYLLAGFAMASIPRAGRRQGLLLAGLFAKSLGNVQSVDLGLDTDSLVTFTLSPRRSGYTAEQATQAFDRIEQ